MRTLLFAWRYLWARPLAAALNVLLLSLGLASIAFLLLVSHHVERAFDRDLPVSMPLLVPRAAPCS